MTAFPGAASADTATPTPSSTESSTSSGTSVPPTNDDAKVQPYAEPSVVFITINWQAWLKDNRYPEYFNSGKPVSLTSTCTGYVVNPDGWIATAGHCVSYKEIQQTYLDVAVGLAIKEQFYNTNSARVVRSTLFDHLKTESSDATGATAKPDRTVTVSWGASASGLTAEEGKPARVVSFQELLQGDGALLKVDEHNMNALILVPGDETVDTLTPIASIGYPGTVDEVVDANYHPSIKTGTVSSQKTIGGGLIPVYEINADVSPGMSGGPTVNYQGEVIGTNSFFPKGENQSFNFVSTSQRILELMDSAGVTNEQSADTQTYREGIDAYFAGDKAVAVAKLSEVKDAQPANEMVQTYLQRAEDLPAAPVSDDSGGIPAWVWLLVGLLVVVAIVVVVVLLLKQNNKSQSDGGAYPVPPRTDPPVEPPPVSQSQPTQATQATQVLPATAPDEQPTVSQPTMRYCASCGHAIVPGQRFCSDCGAEVAGPTGP